MGGEKKIRIRAKRETAGRVYIKTLTGCFSAHRQFQFERLKVKKFLSKRYSSNSIMIILNYKKYCKLFLEKNLVVILCLIKIY